MSDTTHSVDPNVTNPSNPGKDPAPADPSNTSNIGQQVEQGVVDIKAGISEQSSEWEDEEERNVTNSNNSSSDRARNYIKHPSPEENNINNEQQ